MKLPRTLFALLVAGFSAFGQPLLAQTAPPADTARPDSSRISAVTLYPGSATVERVLRVPAGARQVRLDCLPAGLQAGSLQVAADAGIRVGDVSIRQQARELLGPACASPLDERIHALEDQIAALQAESQGIDYATGYLKSFEGAGASAVRGSDNPVHIAPTAQALRQTAQNALTRQHHIQRQQQALQTQLKPLLAERQRTGAAHAQLNSVRITVAAPQGGQLRLSYQVRGPGWQPSYRASLDSSSQQVRLQRLALVSQNTGEDWRDVQLRLSTGQPNASAQAPLPRPWRVDLAPPPQAIPIPAPPPAPAPMTEGARLRAAKAASAVAEGAANAQDDDSAMPASFDPVAQQTGFATEFSVPQRISVPSDGQQVLLSLDEHQASATLLARTTPAQSPHAYLIAQFPAPPGVWPDGPLALYRDSAFVGQSRLRSADVPELPRQGLSFGRDDLISVQADAPERTDSSGGFIANRHERQVLHRWRVQNRHPQAITLQVLDAAPIAAHTDVRVRSQFDPAPATTQWNNQAGLVMWQQSLPAGASQTFRAEHILSWPQDARLRDRP